MIPITILDSLVHSQPVPDDVQLGQLAILSVGRGDMKISFDSDNPEDVERARIAVQDMLSRGYMLFVDVEGELVKVAAFDPTHDEYIIKIDKRSRLYRQTDKTKHKPKTKRISVRRTRGTAVAPTSGG